MIIGIDFDGTCTTHEFPEVGKDIGAVAVLRALVENGHQLILFTMRSDKGSVRSEDKGIVTSADHYLTKAVNWFKSNGIELYGIQTNPTQKDWTDSPKAYCQLYIDDAALGCPLKMDSELSDRPFVDWIRVAMMLSEIELI
jgi:hypothetical protein